MQKQIIRMETFELKMSFKADLKSNINRAYMLKLCLSEVIHQKMLKFVVCK